MIGGPRVTVVDDEESSRNLICMGLRHEGFVVDARENGRSALAAVPAFRPNLIVLNVMMPDGRPVR